MRISTSQALAFRLGAQRLAVRGDDPSAVLAGWSVQDSPPGSAALALAARTEPLATDWLDRALHEERSAVALYNPRTATAIVPADDVGTFTAGLLPPDDAALRFVLGRALPDGDDERVEGPPVTSPQEAVQVAVAAVEQALDGRTLSRDQLHEQLRASLPADLLPWCPGCKSHHARRGLLVMMGLHGRLCIAGREGRQPRFARTDQWLAAGAAPGDTAPAGAIRGGSASGEIPPPIAAAADAAPTGPDRDAAAAEVVRRYLHANGPSTPQLFAQWAGIAPHHARRSWELVAGELVELELEGAREPRWLLGDDAQQLADPEPARGVRLLPPGDPLLLARDRELLIEDAAVRRRAWSAIGSPGLVLVDGRPRALWRGRKKRRRLEIALEPFGGALARRALTQIEAAAVRVAPHRGCGSATVELTDAER